DLSEVQGDARARGERPPEFLSQLGVERRRAQGLRRRLDLVGQEGPTREVEGDVDQRLVQRQGDRREAPDAGLVAQGVGQHLTERDPDVFDRVVGVDVEVALGLDGEVEAAVLAELGEHVVEEGEAGADLGLPLPVDGETDADRRLLGGALAARLPTHASTSPSADRNALFSVAVPTVTRRHPSRRGQLVQLRTSTERSTNSSQTLSPSLVRGRNSTKLAADGHASTGNSPRAATTRPRSSTIDATRSSISGLKRRASRPAACFMASRWYGSSTPSRARTTSGGPTR